MSGTFARRLADGVLLMLHVLAPRDLRRWVEAIRAEAAQLPTDTAALRFVAASVPGLLTIFARTALAGARRDAPGSPRVLAALAATGAVGLGAVHMVAAGAPAAMPLVNAMALALGLLMCVPNQPRAVPMSDAAGVAMIAIAAALLATALFGVAVHGAVRWVAIGPLTIQPSLILLPPLLMIFARTVTATGSAAIAIAALAVALQPDRAMAGTMVAGLVALWSLRREPPVSLALAASALGFLVTLARPDGLPAAPYSDGIFATAWQVHTVLGLAVWLGAALLLLPCLRRGAGDAAGERSRAVFAATWLAITLAAVSGNHPAPLVGYGGSAILGYLLAARLLPTERQRRLGGGTDRRPRAAGRDDATRVMSGSLSCA